MPGHSRKVLFPNPFYVVLLVASTAFVMTALGYLVSPIVEQHALEGPRAGPRPGSIALALWLDRQGPIALAVEFVVMLGSALLAMATDRWFPARPERPGPEAHPGH